MKGSLGCVLLLTGLLGIPAYADPADRLDTAVDDLQAVVADLENAQSLATELRDRLSALEADSAGHLAALRAQEALLDRFKASVADLEAHDKASLTLARDLRLQLEKEKNANRWLWPVAGVAVVAALVEGFFLWR